MLFRAKRKRTKRRNSKKRRTKRRRTRRRRFRLSFFILPGVRLNISRSGISITFGFRNMKATIGSGRNTVTQSARIGFPGGNYSVTRKLTRNSHKRR